MFFKFPEDFGSLRRGNRELPNSPLLMNVLECGAVGSKSPLRVVGHCEAVLTLLQNVSRWVLTCGPGQITFVIRLPVKWNRGLDSA